MSGNRNGASQEVMAVMYDTSDLNFNDPRAPRFLFVDSKGKTALGIGGYVEASMQYDFDGAIDNPGFVTASIPVPSDPKLRSRLAFDASSSKIFLRLVRSTPVGMFSAYVENGFTGSYGFKLKFAYVSLGAFTAGLQRSLFVDAASGSPTIDSQGPAGANCGRNVGFSFTPRLKHGWRVGIAVEMPEASYTEGAHTESISQRVPDIPAYVQYSWDGGTSHVRASAIFRDLSYRDLVAGRNRFATGWGIQLSGLAAITDYVTLYYQGTYGKGIARYINDLSDSGFDLIPDSEPGRLKAPMSLLIAAGLQVNITKDLFVSGTYSLNRLYGQGDMGADAYRRGNYFCFNAFYTCLQDMQIGVEYIRGGRTNFDRTHGTANRLEAMIKYSF